MGISSIFGGTGAVSGLTASQQTTKNGTSSTATSATSAPQDSFQSDFADLLASVQAGDINGAQSALTQLQSVLQSSGVYSPDSTSALASASSTSSSPASATQNDIDSLFQAVQSGNITGAQSALAQLQSDASSQTSGAHAGGRHHHHHHGGGGSSTQAASSSTQDSTSDSSGTSIWSTDASSTALPS